MKKLNAENERDGIVERDVVKGLVTMHVKLMCI